MNRHLMPLVLAMLASPAALADELAILSAAAVRLLVRFKVRNQNKLDSRMPRLGISGGAAGLRVMEAAAG